LMHLIRVGDGTVEYTVRRSDRAKRISIRVSPGLVEAVLPRGMDESHAHLFVARNISWILRKTAESRERELDPLRARWPDAVALPGGGFRVTCMGETVLIPVVQGRRTEVGRSASGRLEVHAPGLPVALPDFENALRSFARSELESRAAALAAAHLDVLRTEPARVRVRDMKTLWGSCNRKGVVTLNLQLARLPTRLIDYTILHELCHLRIMGHGEGFRALLGRLMPDFDEARRLLRRYG